MRTHYKFLLSTIAAGCVLSTVSLASEKSLESASGDKKTVDHVAPASDVKTAALATPLPSATKVFGPKRPQVSENQSEDSQSEEEQLAQPENPPASPAEPALPSLSENTQKSDNPFLYNEPDEAPKTTELSDLPENPDLPETSEDKKLAETPVIETPDYNQQVTEAIQVSLKSALKGGNRLERKDRKAIATFYEDHSFEALWVKDGELTSHATALIKRLQQADKDGLDHADYAVKLPQDTKDPAAMAAFEFALSKALLHYARDAQAGRVAPSSVSRSFKIRPVYPDPQSVMLKLATSTDKVAALASYNPPHAAYKALRAELAKLRAATDIKVNVHVPTGKSMALGYSGERVKLLRERLNIPTLAEENAGLFDETVKTAVKAFQTENHLIADGIAGPKTLRVMNEENVNRIPDIIANMERWRWMARDLGKLHVIANIPSYNVTVMKNGQNIHRTRVVVGKTKHKTPIFSDQMEFVVVNPYWNVPYSIASKELLPNIRSNPNYVTRKNYEVLSGSRVINPTSVNWNENSFKRLRIRQRPGGANALGNVKFLFPNDYAIYFHDTPSKSLFQRATRAFSHGCVRIHNPFEFGNVLMEQTKGWKHGRLKSMVGGKEKWIRLKKDERIPVHIAYFTAVSDADGTISYKSDVYGHNTRLKRALGLI